MSYRSEDELIDLLDGTIWNVVNELMRHIFEYAVLEVFPEKDYEEIVNEIFENIGGDYGDFVDMLFPDCCCIYKNTHKVYNEIIKHLKEK